MLHPAVAAVSEKAFCVLDTHHIERLAYRFHQCLFSLRPITLSSCLIFEKASSSGSDQASRASGTATSSPCLHELAHPLTLVSKEAVIATTKNRRRVFGGLRQEGMHIKQAAKEDLYDLRTTDASDESGQFAGIVIGELCFKRLEKGTQPRIGPRKERHLDRPHSEPLG